MKLVSFYELERISIRETKMMSARARVFISCGQSKGTDEVEIAKQIAEGLEELGYDPCIYV